jgi:hypothetical protein
MIAGALTCGMALYHFWLPWAFHWGDVLTRGAMLRWALFMLNASFSVLLLAGGILSLVVAFDPGPRHRVGTGVIVAMAGYWVFNAAYQVWVPMPLPGVLAGLRWAFGGFAVAVALLYAAGLLRPRPAPEGAAAPAPVRGGRR